MPALCLFLLLQFFVHAYLLYHFLALRGFIGKCLVPKGKMKFQPHLLYEAHAVIAVKPGKGDRCYRWYRYIGTDRKPHIRIQKKHHRTAHDHGQYRIDKLLCRKTKHHGFLVLVNVFVNLYDHRFSLLILFICYRPNALLVRLCAPFTLPTVRAIVKVISQR